MAEYIAIILLSILLLLLIWTAVNEVLFYKKIGWDFSKNSNSYFTMYDGESTDDISSISNRRRILYGYPSFIAGACVLCIFALCIKFKEFM